MSEGKGTVRLSKVVTELNVGMTTLVEHLAKKGHTVEAKPMAKLSEEQYQILLSDFQTDKKTNEEAKQLGKSRASKKAEVTIETNKPRTSVKEEEFEDDGILVKTNELVNQEKKSAKEAEKEIVVEVEKVEPIVIEKVEAEVIEEKPEEKSTLKVLGKIDLDSLNSKTRPEKKSKKKGVEEPIQEKVEVPEVVEVKEEVQVIEVIETPAAEVITEVESPKVTEPNYEKLSGLKVMGKIELPVEQPKKPTPVASSSDNSTKKKRKRTNSNFVGGTQTADKFKNFSGDRKPGTGGPGSNRPGGAGPNRGKGRGPFVKPEEKTEISDKQVQDKLKETLARMNPGSKNPNLGAIRSKIRKQKRDVAAAEREEAMLEEEMNQKVLKATEFVTANELAQMMNVGVTQIISACMTLGMMVSINQRLDAETIAIVADEFGYKVEFVSAEVVENVEEDEDEPEDLTHRAPIVTVMGHVDHGKTSLLDYVRKANVIAGEAGGITQHIGAYEVTLESGKKIAFLDTPGHEAFTAMRARGAKITDIVIVVIAADDSVMPQTREAISHAQAAGVPIVFAINKIDREGANPEKIREQLASMNILVEDWGGSYQCQEISAKKGLNVDLLLEKVLLQAEMLELKANPDRRAVGSIIEASMDKGRGIVATVMVQTGTLRVGDPVIAGIHSARVRALFDERGKKITEAGPSTPCVILGFDGAPQAGDKFIVTKNEQEAKEIANKRQQLQREQGIRTQKHITLDEIGRRLAIGNFKELKVIVKGDVDGSVEALSDSLIKLSTEEVQVSVIYKAVGQISESDVMLASASDAVIIGFQVRPSPQARKLAENEAIDIRLYSIIYDAIDQIKSAIEGMHTPKTEEKIMGNAEIREVFKISKVGSVAGCMVTDGKIIRSNKVRLIRDGVVVYTGDLSSLKRFKEDAKEVSSGYDCGMTIANYNDLKVGDYIESYEEVVVSNTTSAPEGKKRR